MKNNATQSILKVKGHESINLGSFGSSSDKDGAKKFFNVFFLFASIS